jgi:hypothetical protein
MVKENIVVKQWVNEVYNAPISVNLKEHLLNDLGLSSDDKKILCSMIEHNGDSNFHYDNTGIPKEKFDRKLINVNLAVFTELIRLSNRFLQDK